MNPDGYELFCNRDESKARKHALPPLVQQSAGVKYVAPRDGDFGGSWIAVSELGLSLCLLNYYPAAAPPPEKQVSRGLLLISLVDKRSPGDVAQSLSTTRLKDYRAFLLLVLGPRATPLFLKWDGKDLSIESDSALPVTTSSFDTEHVVERRRAMFMQLQGEPYHLSRDPEGGAYSVCMTRNDAQTVSFSHVIVSGERIEFCYRARGGDAFGEPVVVSCPRKGGS